MRNLYKMSSTRTAIILLSTVPSEEIGKKIAHELVSKKLVACVNRIPGLTSVYWWDGKVNEDKEELLVMKSTSDKMQDIKQELLNLHPYDCPELISMEIDDGLPDYLAWISKSTSTIP